MRSDNGIDVGNGRLGSSEGQMDFMGLDSCRFLGEQGVMGSLVMQVGRGLEWNRVTFPFAREVGALDVNANSIEEFARPRIKS